MTGLGRVAVAVLMLAVAAPVLAEAPTTSPRPQARGDVAVDLVPKPEAAARPEQRPKGLFSRLRKGDSEAASKDDAEQTAAAPSELENSQSSEAVAEQRPSRRPKGLSRLFNRAAQPAPKRYPVKGSVCNDRTIRGTAAGNISGKGACGIKQAVRVTELGGVTLSSPALIDCTTAQRFNAWVQNVALPAVGDLGGGLVRIKLLSSYSCRTRNNRPGARLSEHANGRAVDIGAFTMKDGSSFSVLKGWRSGTYGPVLREMHQGACQRFGTVLGPNSDRFHQDHFHFDTARYRSGSYCR